MWSIFPRLILSFFKSVGGVVDWLTAPIPFLINFNIGFGAGADNYHAIANIAPIEILTTGLITTLSVVYICRIIIMIKQAFWVFS